MGRVRALAAVAAVAGSGATGVGPAAAQQLPPELGRELERRAAAIVDSHPIPGLAVGVVIGDDLVYAGGFGEADREAGLPVTSRILFQVGSVTKSLTATLAAVLHDRGTLRWDDPIVERLWEPEVVPDTSLTVRHLLTHTSGLPGDPPTLRRRHDDYPILAFTHFELYRSLEAAELSSVPGTEWSYSNFGYGVLGHVLERASGRPYETLLSEELLDPLGMTSTTVTLWPELRGRLATPYYVDDATGELVRYTAWDEEALAPAGGVSSTVVDLGRFVSFLLRVEEGTEGRLERTTLRHQQSILHRLSPTHGYGMGWFVEHREDVGRVVYHGGGVDGYSAWLEIAPEHGVGVIVLVNSGRGEPIVPLARWVLSETLASASEQPRHQDRSTDEEVEHHEVDDRGLEEARVVEEPAGDERLVVPPEQSVAEPGPGHGQ